LLQVLIQLQIAFNVNAVLLPDGKVLIFGGHDNFRGNHTESGRAMTAELFDPELAMADPENYEAIETGSMALSRMYHSTRVLLPDGSIMAAGGFDMHLGEPPQQATLEALAERLLAETGPEYDR